MTQDFTQTVSISDNGIVALTETLPDNDMAVATGFAGATEPAVTFAYMTWNDTTNKLRKLRNAANSAWVIEGPLLGSAGRMLVTYPFSASLSATTADVFFAAPAPLVVVRIGVLSATATVSSVAATTEWQWALRNMTASVELFSAVVGTGTVLGGVGGGELAANAVHWLTANQNATLAASATLRFTATKVGSPTSPLLNVRLILDAYEVGA